VVVLLVRAVAVRHHQVPTKLALNSLSKLRLLLRVISYHVANQSVVFPVVALAPPVDLLASTAGLALAVAVETSVVIEPAEVAVSATSRR